MTERMGGGIWPKWKCMALGGKGVGGGRVWGGMGGGREGVREGG